MRSKLEIAVNVATVGLVVAVVVVVLGRRDQPASATRDLTRSATLSKSLGIDFGKAPRTLVVVLQEECSFCTASMPFYRTLIETRTLHHTKLQIAVAAPQRNTGIAAYLAAQHVEPDAIVNFKRSDLPQVHATPTLLVAGSHGEVLVSWNGALSPGREAEVLDYLFRTSS